MLPRNSCRYTITSLAGNVLSVNGGFGGDGGQATGATFNLPQAIAVDTAGNIYIADTGNALIREINAQTGVIQTIAGIAPTKCTGVVCSTVTTGCADGVPALTNTVAAGGGVGGKIEGIAVDGYGNVYWGDYNTQALFVLYKAGTQVANFITLEDGANGVATAGGVKPGYVYAIAGTFVRSTCKGTTTASATTDKVLATSGTMHDPAQVTIDGQGNIYFADYGNNVVRVINTQTSTQTFFGVSLAPGFMGAILNCSGTASYSLTAVCPTTNGIGGPAAKVLFGNANSLTGIGTDRYGNVFEVDTKGATFIYGGVAYAGGAQLAQLLTLEATQDAQSYTITPGNFYPVVDNPFISSTLGNAVTTLATTLSNLLIRPTAINVDPLNNIYALDPHYPDAWRVDVSSGVAFRLFDTYTFTGATASAPIDCGMALATPATTGVMTSDPWGDGCPVPESRISATGNGYFAFDGLGNVYFDDENNELIRKLSLNNHFASTPVAGTLTQTVQVHFDGSNLPVQVGAAPSITTTTFQMLSGTVTDFTIVGSPTCSNLSNALDTSLDCLVTIAFTPALPGPRSAVLQATTANSSVYSFGISGIGTGGQIAVDGGVPSVLSAKTGAAASVAVSAQGTVYIADSKNNNIVVTPAGSTTSTTTGTGLSGPKGVAVDFAGNVYVSDTGNNRVVEIANLTSVQTTLATGLNAPQGLAVDALGNVYVADTGNKRVLEIPANPLFPPLTVLQYSGAQAFVTPVAIAVDSSNNVYVADAGNGSGVIKILAGGGDLQPLLGTTNLAPASSIVSFGTATLSAPSGVAVDAAGDLYVSDATGNVVEEIPSATGPGSQSFAMSFTGLSSPGAVAIDPLGNLYVVDTANNRVVFENRAAPSVNFGGAAVAQPAVNSALTVTNIGNAALAVASPFSTITGDPTDFSTASTCTSAALGTPTLTSGLHCSLTASFAPTVKGALTATDVLQGGAASISLSGIGQLKLALVTVTTSPSSGFAAGQTPVVTATVTQPAGTNTPTGAVIFSYTVNGVAGTSVTQPLVDNGAGGGVASFTLPALLLGRIDVVNVSYGGDSLDSANTSTPLTITVPGRPITVVASSVSYVYGTAVPAITGTVTGILPADAATVKYTFSTTAKAGAPVGTYPITVVFSGGNYQDYGFPSVVTSTGAAATVTETPAPLTVVVSNAPTIYGTANVTYADKITGAVNGDSFNVSFTPALSSLQPVGTYSIVPTLTDVDLTGYDHVKNYTLAVTNGKLTVTQATATLAVVASAGAVLPTNLAGAGIKITVVPLAVGVPTGTVALTDVFTAITSTGTLAAVTNPVITLPMTNGVATYTPTSTTLGTHAYSFTYSGDINFGTVSTASPTNVIVDTPDFTIASTTDPVNLLPGVIPGGVATVTGEQAAYPETATVTIAPILGYSGIVNLTCTSPSSYVTCTLLPTFVTMAGTTASMTSVVSISVPATLPINFTSELKNPGSGTFLALLPLGALAFLPLCYRSRRRLSKALWLMLAIAAVSVGVSGCGGNSVKFYTPVPAGPQNVTLTATSGGLSRSFSVQLEIQ